MPTFVGQISDDQILVNVAVSLPDPHPRHHSFFNALLDSGAQMTMITEKVVTQAGLAPIGSTSIIPASGKVLQTNKYRVRIDVPITERIQLPGGQEHFNPVFRGTQVDVAELPYQSADYDILLGMDFIVGGHLTIHGDFFIFSS